MKKFTALFLCFLLLFFAPSAAYASTAGSVVVSGGSIGSGGLSGGYSQKTESSAITLTMALMYSLGITVKLSQDAINAGESAYSYVKGKFYEWVGGSSAEQMTDSQYEELKSRFSVINGGSNVDPDGKIFFNGTALDLIRRFLNWLDVSDFIHDNNTGSSGDTTVNGTLYTDSVSYVDYSTNYTYRDDLSTNCAVCAIKNGDGYYWYFYYNTQNFTVDRFRNNNHYTYRTPQLESGFYWAQSAGKMVSYNSNVYLVDDNIYGTATNGIINYLRGLNGQFEEDSGQTEDEEGFNYNGDFDPNTLNNPDGNQTVVDPPLIDQMKNQNPDADASIGVDKYLEALKQILNQITNPLAVPESVPAQDLTTLAPVEIPVPDNLPVAWPVELPSSPTATPDLPQDNTPVVDPAKPADPEVSIPEMSVHLEEYFPFCLPFDVYKIMQKFNGSPQAPEVHLSFDAPTLNLHIPLDLDFSVFDSVAAVLRSGESILYVVGLCVVTRKTFLRA